jgi:hypothetical protein
MREPIGRLAPAPLAPTEIQTFSKGDDRARLTSVALKAFIALSEQWGMTGVEAAALLGVSESTWDRIKRGSWNQPLSQDQMTRASAVIGLYKGLKLLFADEMSDRWPKLPNSGFIFQKKSPIEAMIEGGIPAMLEVRRYIDAVRGGL